MTPSPTIIMKAPGCKKPIKFSTIGSGNTFGATFWTDGKRETPMLPDEPWLRKCRSEGVMFWSDECEEMGEIDFFSEDSGNADWKDLDYAEEPSEDDYSAALHSGLADTLEKERYIRMRLWWCRNDHFLRGGQSYLSDTHRDNLECFAALLSDEDDNQRLMKAEVLRHISRFDEALHLLDGNFPEGYSRAVRKLQELAHLSNSNVAKLE